MPFADELGEIQVTLVPYQPRWAVEFQDLADTLAAALGGLAVAIRHVGSTAVPGLPAKDVLDLQVEVADVGDPAIATVMLGLGFRLRPEPWNRSETSFGVSCAKMVFAPPVGGRPLNIHVREAGAPNARYALLFRDFLRGHPDIRDDWGAFKTRLAGQVDDLMLYGPIKDPATRILMRLAARWAEDTGWDGSARPR